MSSRGLPGANRVERLNKYIGVSFAVTLRPAQPPAARCRQKPSVHPGGDDFQGTFAEKSTKHPDAPNGRPLAFQRWPGRQCHARRLVMGPIWIADIRWAVGAHLVQCALCTTA